MIKEKETTLRSLYDDCGIDDDVFLDNNNFTNITTTFDWKIWKINECPVLPQ